MERYTVADAERLAEKLLAKPVPERRAQALNKQGLIREILPAIETLVARGYTMAQVAESMREEGFEITLPTLMSYLQRAKGKRSKPSRSRGREAARATTAQAKASLAEPGPVPAPTSNERAPCSARRLR